jgi:diadenosine tetraphosphate (Ap4A) HIT family hydrolase
MADFPGIESYQIVQRRCGGPPGDVFFWIASEHAIAFAADAPATDGHIVVVPSVHALPMAAQRAGRLGLVIRRAWAVAYHLVPDGGFSIGFDAAGSHAVIHLVPRRAGG